MSAKNYEFILPDLGEGIAEAEIRSWLVAEGDLVEEHQAVVELETDKAVAEVPTPRAGRVARLNKQEGEIARVGEVLMEIAIAQEEPARTPSFGIVGVLPEAEDQPQPVKAANREVKAMPAVRALAKEKGVDLARLKGSGPAGSITVGDVKRAAGDREPAAPFFLPGGQRIPLSGLRRSIARHLRQAQQQTVFVTTMLEVDVSELWALKTRKEEAFSARGQHLTFMPFFIKAAQHALQEYPWFNASFDADTEEVVLYSEFHVGIAIETEEGLLVPVIRDVAKKTIVELSAELQELAVRARERRIPREELTGSTFTITNFGAFGGGFATPVINYPNVAILGCGKISEKPWVVGGEIVVRRILPLSLTFDHQVVDGAVATRFLERIGAFLEDLGLLFIESR